jgi:hypothetical protein
MPSNPVMHDDGAIKPSYHLVAHIECVFDNGRRFLYERDVQFVSGGRELTTLRAVNH